MMKANAVLTIWIYFCCVSCQSLKDNKNEIDDVRNLVEDQDGRFIPDEKKINSNINLNLTKGHITSTHPNIVLSTSLVFLNHTASRLLLVSRNVQTHTFLSSVPTFTNTSQLITSSHYVLSNTLSSMTHTFSISHRLKQSSIDNISPLKASISSSSLPKQTSISIKSSRIEMSSPYTSAHSSYIFGASSLSDQSLFDTVTRNIQESTQTGSRLLQSSFSQIDINQASVSKYLTGAVTIVPALSSSITSKSSLSILSHGENSSTIKTVNSLSKTRSSGSTVGSAAKSLVSVDFSSRCSTCNSIYQSSLTESSSQPPKQLSTTNSYTGIIGPTLKDISVKSSSLNPSSSFKVTDSLLLATNTSNYMPQSQIETLLSTVSHKQSFEYSLTSFASLNSNIVVKLSSSSPSFNSLVSTKLVTSVSNSSLSVKMVSSKNSPVPTFKSQDIVSTSSSGLKYVSASSVYFITAVSTNQPIMKSSTGEIVSSTDSINSTSSIRTSPSKSSSLQTLKSNFISTSSGMKAVTSDIAVAITSTHIPFVSNSLLTTLSTSLIKTISSFNSLNITTLLSKSTVDIAASSSNITSSSVFTTSTKSSKVFASSSQQRSQSTSSSILGVDSIDSHSSTLFSTYKPTASESQFKANKTSLNTFAVTSSMKIIATSMSTASLTQKITKSSLEFISPGNSIDLSSTVQKSSTSQKQTVLTSSLSSSTIKSSIRFTASTEAWTKSSMTTSNPTTTKNPTTNLTTTTKPTSKSTEKTDLTTELKKTTESSTQTSPLPTTISAFLPSEEVGQTKDTITIHLAFPFGTANLRYALIVVQKMPKADAINTDHLLHSLTWFEVNKNKKYQYRKYRALKIQVKALKTILSRKVYFGRQRRDLASQLMMITIGKGEGCDPPTEFCNGALQENSQYRFQIEAVYTHGPPRNSSFTKSYKTLKAPPDDGKKEGGPSTAILIVLCILLLLFFLVIVIITIIVFRRKYRGRSICNNDDVNCGLMGPCRHPVSSCKSPIRRKTFSGPDIAMMNKINIKGMTRPVHVKDFNAWVMRSSSDSDFRFAEEFESMRDVGKNERHEAADMPENRGKNRYVNVLPFDHTRVKLAYIDDEPGSDYINASYIHGYKQPRAYIATQGPLLSTTDDFWRMIWEQKTKIIVMITQCTERGRVKCHEYWPSIEPATYADVVVSRLTEYVYPDWIEREFLVECEGETRQIRHFQFISWPDHGVPRTTSPVLEFVQTIKGHQLSSDGPLVCHCSAGVGRTGTYLCIDMIINQLIEENSVDVYGMVCVMRSQRCSMVQTEDQYIFIHRVILEYLNRGEEKQNILFKGYSLITPITEGEEIDADMDNVCCSDGDSGICDEVFRNEKSPTKQNGVAYLGNEVFSTPMNGICETVT